MKKSTRSLLACTLALSLAVPAIAGTDAAAAGKKPKLTPKSGATIITGKSKGFVIKNVKKANVKSLKVKIWNKSVAKMTKKVLKKKKVGFVVKGIGGGVSDMTVVLKLKKKQAGKKVYKFENLTIQSGIADAPEGLLTDAVTGNSLIALVLKAGTEASFDNPDNSLLLEVSNGGEIGGRNYFIHWFENGVEKEEWSRDGAGGKDYRPDTPASTVPAPVPAASGSAVSGSAVSGSAVSGSAVSGGTATGSAVGPTKKELGVTESTYYCELENMLSGKKSTTNTKTVRIVPQHVIDYSNNYIATFKSKYSTGALPTDAATKDAYLNDFARLTNSFGYVMGVTHELLVSIKEGIEATKNDPKLLQENLVDNLAMFTEDFINVGKYIGLSQADVESYINYFKAVVTASITDSNIDITKLL